MQGWSASAPIRAQSFRVSCAQGHSLLGQRTEGYQALRCPTCGEGIFVLPRSPFPEPPVPASATRSRIESPVDAFPEDDPLILTDPISSNGPVEVDVPEAEIEWDEEIPTDEPAKVLKPPTRPKPPSPSAKPGQTAGPSISPRRAGPRQEAPEPVILVEDRPTLREWATRHRNSLLVVGLLVLIVGTVAIRRRRQRLEDLPRVAELGRTQGLKKLDLGEFHVAKKLLGDAAEAVDGLGGRFEGADEIRQGALEAALFAVLAPKGVDEILEEAATGDPKEWPSRFSAMYKGRSVILDPPLSEVPDPARPSSHYQVNYPIYFGRGPKADGKGRLNLDGFKLFELSQPKVDEQKPFGARYGSIELDLATNEWVVTLEPGSGAFITHPKALESINWATSELAEEPGP